MAVSSHVDLTPAFRIDDLFEKSYKNIIKVSCRYRLWNLPLESFKMDTEVLAASKEHKAWHVWVLRERTKQFKMSVLGLFTTWRKTSVTTLLWSWNLSLYVNSLSLSWPWATLRLLLSSPLPCSALLRLLFSTVVLATLSASIKWAGRPVCLSGIGLEALLLESLEGQHS